MKGLGLPLLVAAIPLAAASVPAQAALSAEELAKLAQNPVGNMVSVPFQYNANLNYGPDKGTQSVLNIQPVYPISASPEWNVITRTILPVVWQPSFGAGVGSASGLGDLQFSAFLSPADPGRWIWGVGAIAQAPTHSDDRLGNDHWGLGPTFVVLHLEKGSPWVYGVLVNNLWSLGGGDDPSYNNGLVQPFLNYNFEGGTYLTSSPIVTVNWKASGSQRWTLPIGGGIGHIFHIGKLPLNTQLAAYFNAARPDYAANWQVRAQVQLMFPK
jgi:hypothetical protein